MATFNDLKASLESISGSMDRLEQTSRRAAAAAGGALTFKKPATVPLSTALLDHLGNPVSTGSGPLVDSNGNPLPGPPTMLIDELGLEREIGASGFGGSTSSSSAASLEDQARRSKSAIEELLEALGRVETRSAATRVNLEELGGLIGGGVTREPGWWTRPGAGAAASAATGSAGGRRTGSASGAASGDGGLIEQIAVAHGGLANLADVVDITHSNLPGVKAALSELRKQVADDSVAIPEMIENLRASGSLLSKEVLGIVDDLQGGGSSLLDVATRLQEFARRHTDTASGSIAERLAAAAYSGLFG